MIVTVPTWLSRLTAVGATSDQLALIQSGYVASLPTLQAAFDTLVESVDNTPDRDRHFADRWCRDRRGDGDDHRNELHGRDRGHVR
jgi:hypothetical protein